LINPSSVYCLSITRAPQEIKQLQGSIDSADARAADRARSALDAAVAAVRDECTLLAHRSAREHETERRRLVDAGAVLSGSEMEFGNCHLLAANH
jgi:hypothetical protein